MNGNNESIYGLDMGQQSNNVDPDLIAKLYAIQEEIRKVQKQNAYLYQQQITQAGQIQQFKAIQSQLKNIDQRLDIFQQSLVKGNNSSIEDSTDKFLLTEFSEICKFWMHTDARMESSLRLYLTVSAVIISAAVFASDYLLSNVSLNIVGALIVLSSLALSIAGFFVATRILGAVLDKTGYFYSLSLIRRFFTERNPEILPYLYFPLADKLMNTGEASLEQPDKLKDLLNSRLLKVVTIWSVFLAGFSVGTLSYTFFPGLPVLVYFFVGTLISILSLLIFGLFKRGKIRRTVRGISKRRQAGITSIVQ